MEAAATDPVQKVAQMGRTEKPRKSQLWWPRQLLWSDQESLRASRCRRAWDTRWGSRQPNTPGRSQTPAAIREQGWAAHWSLWRSATAVVLPATVADLFLVTGAGADVVVEGGGSAGELYLVFTVISAR